jgi:hypothetical protein
MLSSSYSATNSEGKGKVQCRLRIRKRVRIPDPVDPRTPDPHLGIPRAPDPAAPILGTAALNVRHIADAREVRSMILG